MCSSKKITLGFFIFLGLFFVSFKCCFGAPLINEFVANSSVEWVEFYNATDSAEFIKEYYLDDDTDFNSDSGSSAKKSLSSLNTTNPYFPFFETGSFLNNGGDWVVLFDSQGNIVDSISYSTDFGENVSMGRSPDGTGSFYVLSGTSQGLPNLLPKATDTPTPSTTPTQTTTSTATPTPTATQTATATPTPTKTATPKASKTPTATPTPTESGEENESSVLGIQDVVSPSPTADTNEVKKKGEFNYLSLVFVASGLLFVCYSVFAFIRQKRLNKRVLNG